MNLIVAVNYKYRFKLLNVDEALSVASYVVPNEVPHGEQCEAKYVDQHVAQHEGLEKKCNHPHWSRNRVQTERVSRNHLD